MEQYQASLELPDAEQEAEISSTNPFLDPRIPTFADLLERVRQDSALKPNRRADLRSALTAFARLMRQEPAAMPALPATYRPRLRRLVPANTGLSAKRLSNIRSEVLFCLRRYGALPRRNALGPIGAGWRPLWDRLSMPQRAALSRFSRWASARGIAPISVSDDALVAFRADLEAESFVANPDGIVASVCRVWTKLRAAQPDLALPPLAIPRRRETYVLAIEAFPVSFGTELEAFCAHLGGVDLFAESGPPRPLKPVSVKRRRFQVLQLASAIVHRGGPAASITGLASLVEPPALRTALRFFVDRAGGGSTTQISQLAFVAIMIAKHWARVDPEQLRIVQGIRGKVACRTRGMTEKNRERLRQFDDRLTLERLLFYADDVLADLAKRRDRSRKAALEAQVAVAVALLIAAPIRLSNLAALELDVHLLRSRSGDDAVWHLVIPAHETKNREPHEVPLGQEVVRVLRIYLKDYRPLLADPASSFLFPSGKGHKATNSLGTLLTERVFRRTGITINPHLFRHFSAKLILEETPGGYGIVQDVLRHRDMATTRGHYAGAEATAAARHYDGVVRQQRQRLRGEGQQ
jgi:integrase